ncbi:phage tail protein [Jiella pelagia]|uniref:Tip attachment protein J domain-containing protein n=1 Tax=Jiella pelagia TaxID=2986949 RepID=A0ABY7BV72_9HYPH|nr:hypothetical protein [Jiella pelagia]WAP67238.1 hypothetical protein OH818_16815 [Jiella pelagia]
MPETIASLIGLALFSAGASVAAVNAAIALTTTLVQIGIAVGAQLAISLLSPRPDAPKPSDMKSTTRQPIPVRMFHYGTNRAGGALFFWKADGANFYIGIVHSSRRWSAIIGYYVNDEIVTVDEIGQVEEYKDRGPNEDDRLIIETRLGLDVETAYARLIDRFPDHWTADHRGDYCVTSLTRLNNPGIEDIGKVFPKSTNTEITLVGETSILWDPRLGDHDDPEAHAFSENAALVILDYLISRWGLRLSVSLIEAAIDDWIVAADICDEDVPLKGGGTEKRWRIAGGYRANEQRSDVLKGWLEACDGALFPTANGGLTLKVGAWEEPDFVIDSSMILAFGQITQGGETLTAANTIRAQYTSRPHGFTEVDADPWIDEDAVSADGELTAEYQFFPSPSHGQTRRLMKIAHRRLNPAYRGTPVLDAYGIMGCLGRRFVTLNLPDFGIVMEKVEIRGTPEFTMDESRTVITGGQIQVSSMSAEAFEWDAETEEGDAPPLPEEIPDFVRVIPVPTGFSFTVVTRTVNGRSLRFGRMVADAPEDVDDTIVFEVSTDAGATYSDVLHDPKVDEAELGPLADGVTYVGRARTRSIGGTLSDPTETQSISGADPVVPSEPISFSVSVSDYVVEGSAVNANDPAVSYVRIHRVAGGGDVADAVAVTPPLYYGANAAAPFTDTPGIGTFDYYAIAYSAEDTLSLATGPETAVVVGTEPRRQRRFRRRYELDQGARLDDRRRRRQQGRRLGGLHHPGHRVDCRRWCLQDGGHRHRLQRREHPDAGRWRDGGQRSAAGWKRHVHNECHRRHREQPDRLPGQFDRGHVDRRRLAEASGVGARRFPARNPHITRTSWRTNFATSCATSMGRRFRALHSMSRRAELPTNSVDCSTPRSRRSSCLRPIRSISSRRSSGRRRRGTSISPPA